MPPMDMTKYSPDDLEALGKKLIDFSHKVGAAGMAARQLVDFPERAFAITIKNEDGSSYDRAYFNPEIVSVSKDEGLFEEGCYSVPQIYLRLKRPTSITVSYIGVDKQSHVEDMGGLLARVFQHEFDHLNGRLIDSRASKLKLDMAKKKKKKIIRRHFQQIVQQAKSEMKGAKAPEQQEEAAVAKGD